MLSKLQKKYKVQAGDKWTQLEWKVRLRQEGDDPAADAKLKKEFELGLKALLDKFNNGKEVSPASSHPVVTTLKA
jgi:hypothetical protein